MPPWFPIRVLAAFNFVYLVPIRRYNRFPHVGTGEMTISAAKGLARPKMTSPFGADFAWVGRLNFSSISHRLKAIRLF
jgi:hypothetical protein